MERDYRTRIHSAQDLPVVVKIWLAVSYVFIGGVKLKVLRQQAGPMNTTLGGDRWEDRISGQSYSVIFLHILPVGIVKDLCVLTAKHRSSLLIAG